VLAAFAPAVHEADPEAKVIYGGQADPTADFTKRALDTCKCASQIDIYAYHTYPGYGKNVHPESMDTGTYGKDSPAKLRELVRNYPGIRKGIEFFDDEFNSIPAWKDSDESVQTKYCAARSALQSRGRCAARLCGCSPPVSTATKGDDFGFLHGKRDLPDDFSPRPVWGALQNTYALFSDTKLDPGLGSQASGVPNLSKYGKTAFQRHAFRNTNGKSIVAFWVAAHSVAGGAFPPFTVTLKLNNSGIKNPVLIDITTGKITPLDWKKGTTDTLAALPLRDAVHAIADADYFDWPVLPEAPSSLTAQSSASGVALKFELHAATTKFAIERRAGDGRWERIATQASATTYTDASAPRGLVRYRVRALNDAGEVRVFEYRAGGALVGGICSEVAPRTHAARSDLLRHRLHPAYSAHAAVRRGSGRSARARRHHHSDRVGGNAIHRGKLRADGARLSERGLFLHLHRRRVRTCSRIRHRLEHSARLLAEPVDLCDLVQLRLGKLIASGSAIRMESFFCTAIHVA
jgi:hypothetical protein